MALTPGQIQKIKDYNDAARVVHKLAAKLAIKTGQAVALAEIDYTGELTWAAFRAVFEPEYAALKTAVETAVGLLLNPPP